MDDNKSVKKAQKAQQKKKKVKYNSLKASKKEAGAKRIGKSKTKVIGGATRRPSEGSRNEGRKEITKKVTKKVEVKVNKFNRSRETSMKSSIAEAKKREAYKKNPNKLSKEMDKKPKVVKISETVKTGEFRKTKPARKVKY